LPVGADRSHIRTFWCPPWGRAQPDRTMVTTGNQGSQQNHFGEDPMAIPAEMKQELEMMRKLREEDRKENERLRQRIDRVERTHTENTAGEGSRRETRREDGSRHETRREEGSRHETRKEEGSRRESRVEGSRHEDRKEGCNKQDRNKETREETSQTTGANISDQYPFTDEIMTTRLPKGWKSPMLDRYDGTSDLDEHINAYVAQLSIYTTDTHVYCKVFPASLRGMALSWFTQLPPKSIDSFENLKTKFAAQFATSKPHNLTPIALANVRQEKGESLLTFMDKFGQVALNIRGLLPEVAMVYLTTALRSGPFADSLAMQPAASMEELRQRAA